MPEEIEFNQADFITIDTIGEKGHRIFHLQVAEGDRLVTLILEKEQASALAQSISGLLEEVGTEFNLKTGSIVMSTYDLELREPILPLFRIAQIGLGYDNEADRVLLIMNELQPEDVPSEQRVVRIAAHRELMGALAENTRNVVAKGRAKSESNGHKMHY